MPLNLPSKKDQDTCERGILHLNVMEDDLLEWDPSFLLGTPCLALLSFDGHGCTQTKHWKQQDCALVHTKLLVKRMRTKARRGPAFVYQWTIKAMKATWAARWGQLVLGVLWSRDFSQVWCMLPTSPQDLSLAHWCGQLQLTHHFKRLIRRTDGLNRHRIICMITHA